MLETHPVSAGFNHSKITLMVDCHSKFWNDARFTSVASANLRYATVGAGPSFGPWGKLVSGINRPRDRDRSHNNYSAVIGPRVGTPGYQAADDMLIGLLLAKNSRYNNKADYAL